MQPVFILLMGLVWTAASFPTLDSPETRLFQSLTQSEQNAVLQMALTGQVVGGTLISDPSDKGHSSPDRMNSPEVLKLALEMRHWIKSQWQLTPDQMEEIKETGKLCNDQGECIDFNGDWGNNCCPFG